MKWFGRLARADRCDRRSCVRARARPGWERDGAAGADRERDGADGARADGADDARARAVRADANRADAYRADADRADADAPAPTVPTPTVPTIPGSTAPIPTPPPVRLPPATQPPATTRPAPPPAPRAAQPTTTISVGAASGTATPRSSSGSAASPSSGAAGSGTGSGSFRPASTTARSRTATFAAKPHRTPHRVSVRLAFVLPAADRMFLIVRGPAPSCEVAGFIPVRGRRGANTVYFAGRVHGRRLDPGVYLISLSPSRRLAPGAATEYVRVVSPRRSVPLPDQARKPSCNSALAAANAVNPVPEILVAEAAPKTPTPRPFVRLAGVEPEGPTGEENDDGGSGLLPDSGVLGAATDSAGEQPFVAIAVLTIVAALLLTMIALVTRFLRGSWNP